SDPSPAMVAVVKSLPVAADAAAAIASQPYAKADRHDRDSSRVLRDAGRCARADTHSAGTSRRSAESHRAPGRHARHVATGISKSSEAIRSTRRLGAGSAHAPSPKPPGPFGPASSPFSAVDLFQRLDRHLPLGDHALELGVLGFQLAQSLHVGGLEFAEPSAPPVNRLLADLMFPGDLINRALIGFAQDQDHLFFGKSNLLHQLLACRAGAIVSSYDWAEKPGQVIPTVRR